MRISYFVGGFRRRATTILLFSYGMALGTATPVMLARCGSTGCSTCAGVCTLSLSILPLLIFMALTGRLKRAGNKVLGFLRSHVNARKAGNA